MKTLTLKDLAALYATGGIHRERAICIDNDDVSLYLPTDMAKWREPPDYDDDDWPGVRVWPAERATPDEVLEEALAALGITARWA